MRVGVNCTKRKERTRKNSGEVRHRTIFPSHPRLLLADAGEELLSLDFAGVIVSAEVVLPRRFHPLPVLEGGAGGSLARRRVASFEDVLGRVRR